MVSTYSAVSSAAGEGLASEVKVWRKRWFATHQDLWSRKPVGFKGHSVDGEHDPGYLIDPGFGGGSLEQAGVEHVI